MYESAFDRDWTSLTREAAMFRAYAIGVDAAFGNRHEDELDRLMRETSRPLVQLAYDEGKSRAEDAIGERRSGADTRGRFSPSEFDYDIWERLVEARREDPANFELVRVPRSQTDLPGALDRPSLLERQSRDVSAVELPRFLLQ